MISLLIAGAIAPNAMFASTPAPPVVIAPRVLTVPSPRQQAFVSLNPVEGRCDDGALDILMVEKPAPQLLWLSDSEQDSSVTLTFRINEAGKPLGIKRDPAGFGAMPDLTPSLAATRFAQGMQRLGCAIRYIRVRTSIADAPIDALIGYSIQAAMRPPKELFDRLQPEGADCYPARPAILLQAYPDFGRVPASDGRTDWSMVKFDIDSSGKPVAIGTLATTGNGALDKASIEAISKSRYAKGKRTGCIYPYWRNAGTVKAPESPDISAYRGDGNCPADIEWKSKPALVYPDNFRRRAVEGWAIVAFDVAPWGGTGNVKLVAAEPAAEFGNAALNVISAATVATSEGFTGCFEKIRYVMKGDGSEQIGSVD